MRIKKTSQTTPTTSQVVNTQSNSITDSYSCNYVNNAVKEVYSTNEQVIGTWIDGKPLYRKVFTGVSAKYALVSTQPTFNIISFNGYIQNVANNGKYPIMGSHSTAGDYSFPYHEGNGEIRIYFSDDQNSVGKYNYNLIIEYTKTTD